MNNLKDSFGRTFPYIRLSISDVCNYKCGYCLPNGYQVDKSDNRKFLHLDEIKRLAKCFSELGVNKIRITGGEPTIQPEFYAFLKYLIAKDVAKNITLELVTNATKIHPSLFDLLGKFKTVPLTPLITNKAKSLVK